MTDHETERPPAAETLRPPPHANPETERLRAAVAELESQVKLAGNIANDASEAASEAADRINRATERLDIVASRLDIVAEQAESAIGMNLTAHQKIDRIYDQIHALCSHLGVPILGEETEQDSSAHGSTR